MNPLYSDPKFARLGPANFALYTSGGSWQLAKHLAFLNRKLIEVATGRTRRLMVSMPPRPQPLTSTVLMADGSYKCIGNLSPGEEVISHTGVARKVLEVIPAGLQTIIKISTAKGVPIEVAPDHPLYVKGKGWIPAKYITNKDQLVSLYNIRSSKITNDITKDEAYVLGLFTGNGLQRQNGNFETQIPADKAHPNYTELIAKTEKYIKLNFLGQDFLKRINFTLSSIHHLCYTLNDENFVAFCCGFFATKRLEHINTFIQVVVRDRLLENISLLLANYGLQVQVSRTTRASSIYVRDLPSMRYIIDMLAGRVTKRAEDEWFKVEHKVKQIDYLPEAPCVCLNVEEDHSYISEGYVTHNSGKSELVSKYFPAWYLGTYPDKKVIFAAYEAHFAAEFGAAARDLLEEHGKDVFGVDVRQGSAAASRWKIEDRMGVMNCAGVGGPMTGKGADCCAAETNIATQQGQINIVDLINMSNPPKILSYNHRENRLEYKKLIAYKVRKNHELYTIETSGGSKVRVTGEHRFFTKERGYTKANLLRVGDTLTETLTQEQVLCQLSQREDRQRNYLQRLLCKNKESNCSTVLRTLRKHFREDSMRIRKATKKKTRRSILLRASLLKKASFVQKREKMPFLQYTYARKKKSKILLGNLYASGNGQEYTDKIRHVEKYTSLQSLVQKNEATDIGERFTSVPLLLYSGNVYPGCHSRNTNFPIYSDNASYRREHREQYSRKYDNAMQKLSPETPYSQQRITRIEKLSKEPELVYDIQVEGNSNFFANGILVHNCLIIDDPIKNDQEAESLLIRNKIFNWFGATSYTRLQPGGSIIIVMTRWHNDDLMGRLIKNMEEGKGEPWEYIRLPAIAVKDEEPFPKGIGRKAGEALWPEMWPLEDLMKIKNSGALSSYYWSALYQQDPVPEGGGLFKQNWFNYYTKQGDYYLLQRPDGTTEYIEESTCWKFVTVDTANKVKDTSDYTAIGVWLVTPKNDLVLCHLVRERLGYENILKKLVDINKAHKLKFIGIENVGIAIQLIIEARNKGLPVKELEPEGKGKMNRANMPMGAVIRMETGKIFFPKISDYTKDVELELLSFPKGAHDEIVDILSYACNELNKCSRFDKDDFAPYSLDDNLPVGMRRKGGIFI